jgi:hypothetical protein
MEAVQARNSMGSAVGRDDAGMNAAGRILDRAEFGRPRMANERVPDAALASPQAVRQILDARLKALADARAARVGPERIAQLSDDLRAARDAMRGQFMENLTDASRLTTEVVNGAGQTARQTSPAGFRRFWDQNAPTAAQLFSPAEMRLLRRLSADFAETSTQATTGAARGSQTVQNMTVGNLIARATNGLIDPTNPLAQTLGSAGGLARFVYQPAETAVRDLFSRALADPAFAQMLLARATPATIRRAAGLMDRSLPDRMAAGALTGAGREVIRSTGRRPEQRPE